MESFNNSKRNEPSLTGVVKLLKRINDRVLLDPSSFNVKPKTMHEAISDFRNGYDKNDVWRLGVDGRLYAAPLMKEQGYIQYENRETNSLKALLRVIKFVVEYLEDNASNPEPFNAEFIKKLHSIIVDKVQLSYDVPPGEFRDKGVTFSLDGDNSTPEGLAKVLDEMEKGEDGLFPKSRLDVNIGQFFLGAKSELIDNSVNPFNPVIQVISISDYRAKHGFKNNLEVANSLSRVEFHAPKVSPDRLNELATRIFDRYYRDIKNANTTNEKIEIIARTIHDLEVLHPFKDANLRTFGIALSMALLLKNGLPPGTYYDPNCFDAFGFYPEAIKRGILNTLKIYADEPLFGFKTCIDMSEEQLKEYQQKYKDELSIFNKEILTQNPILELLSQNKLLDEKTIYQSLSSISDIRFKLHVIERAFDVISKLPLDESVIQHNLTLLQNEYFEILNDIPSVIFNRVDLDGVVTEQTIQNAFDAYDFTSERLLDNAVARYSPRLNLSMDKVVDSEPLRSFLFKVDHELRDLELSKNTSRFSSAFFYYDTWTKPLQNIWTEVFDPPTATNWVEKVVNILCILQSELERLEKNNEKSECLQLYKTLYNHGILAIADAFNIKENSVQAHIKNLVTSQEINLTQQSRMG